MHLKSLFLAVALSASAHAPSASSVIVNPAERELAIGGCTVVARTVSTTTLGTTGTKTSTTPTTSPTSATCNWCAIVAHYPLRLECLTALAGESFACAAAILEGGCNPVADISCIIDAEAVALVTQRMNGMAKVSIERKTVDLRELTFWLAKLACARANWLVSGVGVDFGGITSPRPADRLASQNVGLASQFVGLAPAKKPKWLASIAHATGIHFQFCVAYLHPPTLIFPGVRFFHQVSSVTVTMSIWRNNDTEQLWQYSASLRAC
ncbi:hypothetical protein DFH06DRAFT_1133979 [Mycena polygramma]|nr:hypothetical protein DFH06DRAFT_1133979 [Mycena polygramma]